MVVKISMIKHALKIHLNQLALIKSFKIDQNAIKLLTLTVMEDS